MIERHGASGVRGKFIEDFGGNSAVLGNFANGNLDIKVWETLAELSGTKVWVRKSLAIQERIKAQIAAGKFSPSDVEKLKKYYNRHLSKKDITTYPGYSSTGQYYDAFAHPDFTNDVKKIRKLDGTQGRPVYEPSGGITGDRTKDAKKANEWAASNFHASDFEYSIGSNECRIKDPNTGIMVDHTWHHHQDGKTMMAVPKDKHAPSNAQHIGGIQAKDEGIIGFFPSPVFPN